jgi:hypothetical protein
MSITEIKEVEKEYGLVEEIPSHADKDKFLSNMKEETKKKYLAEVKEKTKPIKAKFKNYMPHGADHGMFFKRYASDNVQYWRFKDGETYTIPKGLAEDVNRRCKKSVPTKLKDANGMPIMKRENAQEFISSELD